MARKPKPSIPRPDIKVDRDSWFGRARLLALKNMLGLGLTPDEEAFLGPLPRVAVFTPEEVIALLGDGERGIPRMLPVDIALGKLGMPITRANPDGTFERLEGDFRKAWLARRNSDRAIATHVAKTYAEVPRGWYLDRERLEMSDADAAGDDLSALGPGGAQALADIAWFFRFDLVPRELRIAGYQMWQRRRLAGIRPFTTDGLVFGFWDDVMSAYDVGALSFRGYDAAHLAVVVALARDLCLAMVAAEVSGAGAWDMGEEDLHCAMIHASVVNGVRYDDPRGMGDPDLRSVGGGLAELYRRLEAKPGAVWSRASVRERPEGTIAGDGGFRFVGDLSVVPPEWPVPGSYVPGGPVPEDEVGWVSRFASA